MSIYNFFCGIMLVFQNANKQVTFVRLSIQTGLWEMALYSSPVYSLVKYWKISTFWMIFVFRSWIGFFWVDCTARRPCGFYFTLFWGRKWHLLPIFYGNFCLLLQLHVNPQTRNSAACINAATHYSINVPVKCTFNCNKINIKNILKKHVSYSNSFLNFTI